MTRMRTVVVGHSKAMVAEGIAAALSQYPGITSVGAVTSAAEVEHRARRAEAAALDADLPGATEVAVRLRRKGVRVVMLAEHARGEEGIVVSTTASIPSLAAALVPEIAQSPWVGQNLTFRQREVLDLVGRGLAAKEVARHLGISPKTVEQHKSKILSKLGVPNQTAAVRLILSSGFGGNH